MKKYIIKIFIFSLVAGFYSSCSTDDSSFIDDLPDAVIDNDPDGAPPRGWDETWNGHSEVLYRQYFDDNVVIYYDDAVERPLEWPYELFSSTWEHVIDTYGDFGEENRLYAVFHGEGTSQPFSSTHLTEEGANKSLIDISLDGFEMSDSNMDTAIREIGHVVENSAYGVNGSPVSDVWGDSFEEIFLYDVFMGLGMEEDGQRVHDTFLESTASYPSADTYWFRDWFLPIYENYGGRTTLNRFFRTAFENYDIEGGSYANQMDLGEFIHFWSGAVGEDLQPLAEEAFGWSDDLNSELRTARAYFPDLDYPFDPTAEIVDLTADATITVNREYGGGAAGAEGSLKVIDNNINTKYLTNPFFDDMWMQQEFPEPRVVNRYSMTSANDASGRDPRSWTLKGSNDGTTWVDLDSRSGESFANRFTTNDYKFENDVAYKYYRINITENNGDGLFQLAEWRLKVWRLIEDPS